MAHCVLVVNPDSTRANSDQQMLVKEVGLCKAEVLLEHNYWLLAVYIHHYLVHTLNFEGCLLAAMQNHRRGLLAACPIPTYSGHPYTAIHMANYRDIIGSSEYQSLSYFVDHSDDPFSMADNFKHALGLDCFITSYCAVYCSYSLRLTNTIN